MAEGVAAGPALVSIWAVVTHVGMCPSVCALPMYALYGMDVSCFFVCVFKKETRELGFTLAATSLPSNLLHRPALGPRPREGVASLSQRALGARWEGEPAREEFHNW